MVHLYVYTLVPLLPHFTSCWEMKLYPFFKSHLKCYLILETLSSSSYQTRLFPDSHGILSYVVVTLCFCFYYSTQDRLSHKEARYSIYISWIELKTNKKLIFYKGLRCSPCQSKQILKKQGTLSLPPWKVTPGVDSDTHLQKLLSVTMGWSRVWSLTSVSWSWSKSTKDQFTQ